MAPARRPGASDHDLAVFLLPIDRYGLAFARNRELLVIGYLDDEALRVGGRQLDAAVVAAIGDVVDAAFELIALGRRGFVEGHALGPQSEDGFGSRCQPFS